MSSINRTLVLNPVEPAPISFKLPTGIETWVNISYLRQTGTPYGSDTASQLYLISRSDRRVLNYPMLMVDVVNGQARAVIPAGDIRDENGYNVQIIGTIDAEHRLIAKGSASVTPTEALGVIPSDMIDTVDLTFDYNAPVELDVTLWQDAGKGAPYDLTEEMTTVSSYIYDRKGGGVLTPFTVTVLAANKVRLSLSKEQVNLLPSPCWWTLSASTAAGLATLCEGSVTISGTVIPALGEATASFDYQKPPTGDVNPINGQIIHGTITQNILKVSKVTQAAQDFSATLELVSAGDEIVVGATTWTVSQADEKVGWYEYMVTPVAQSATSGVTIVTFRRPI